VLVRYISVVRVLVARLLVERVVYLYGRATRVLVVQCTT